MQWREEYVGRWFYVYNPFIQIKIMTWPTVRLLASDGERRRLELGGICNIHDSPEARKRLIGSPKVM